MDFGTQVLGHPLVVEAIEDLFVPACIYNNVEGKDARVLKSFGERSWNNPVTRIVDTKRKDVVGRNGAGWSVAAVLGQMREALRERGVVSRFAVDFVTTRGEDGTWKAYAIEINLRMGGTTIPFQALQFLTGGQLDAGSGEFIAPSGRRKYYRATDSLTSPAYVGLLPEDLMDILDVHGLGFSSERKTGVLFHMMGALSEHGKLGVTTIGDSAAEAEDFFRRTVEVLDLETGESPSEDGPRRVQPPPGRRLPME